MPLDDPWLPTTAGLARPATPIQVARYDPDDADAPYELLDNVVCVSVTDRLGTDPGLARLRYRFTGLDPNAPQSADEALDVSHSGGKLIVEGDRIVVQARRPDGTWEPIFDGFALGFELTLDSRREVVSIACVGVAKRCWDAPIGGAVFRDGNNLIDGDDLATEEVAHFNPRGRKNCLPRNAEMFGETDDPDKAYPTFVDPENLGSVADPGEDDLPRQWTFPDAARYLVWGMNREEPFVKNPLGSDLDAILVSREPKDGVSFDPEDPDTYDAKPIVVPDKPVTGKDWPSALRDLLAGKGFETRWALAGSGDDPPLPETTLRVLDTQTGPVKDLWLQPRGSALDLTLTNLGQAEVARSLIEVVNEWDVQGELEEYEASFVLACGFPAVESDGDTSEARAKFTRTDPTFIGANHDKYRLFIFDECGEGHYLPTTDVLKTDVPTLDKVLGEPITIDGKETPQYAHRRRRPIGQLISTDDRKTPLRARLSISKDYTGACPAVWDGGAASAGTWQPVQGGYQILKDRIGVYLDVQDPDDWWIGKSDVTGHPFRAGVVQAVQCLAAPSATRPKFYLRLTCVIRGDRRVRGYADRPLNSPLATPIRRTVDAHERYRKQIISAHSEMIPTTGADVVARDDSDLALAEATAIQLSTQAGVLGGSVVVPRFTRYYEPGDRLRSIQGRGLGLRTDNGGSDAAPNYPVVIARTHHLEGRQGTVLELSDANPHRRQYRNKLGGNRRA